MRVLPYNIFYVLRLFPVLESEGLVWVFESLRIRLVSLVVTQDGFLFRFRSEIELTMAAGKNIPELGGYDFEFTSVVPNDLECPVCQLTLKDPINIGGCGHRLCNICLESLLR